MSRPFRRLTKDGYPLIDFLTDISRCWVGCLPDFIYISFSNDIGESFGGIYIYNEIDQCYYKVEETGDRPKYTLGESFSLTNRDNLNNITVHSIEIIPSVFSFKLGRTYDLDKDLPKFRRWLDKYKPDFYK